jgi:hypothetical protein
MVVLGAVKNPHIFVFSVFAANCCPVTFSYRNNPVTVTYFCFFSFCCNFLSRYIFLPKPFHFLLFNVTDRTANVTDRTASFIFAVAFFPANIPISLHFSSKHSNFVAFFQQTSHFCCKCCIICCKCCKCCCKCCIICCKCCKCCCKCRIICCNVL